MVLGDLIITNTRLYPNKLALFDDLGYKASWSELNARVNRLINALFDLGIRKGGHVAIIAENSHYFGEFALAAAKGGITAVYLNYRLAPAQMVYVLNQSEANALIIQDKFAPEIEPHRAELQSIEHFIGIGTHNLALDYDRLMEKSSGREPDVPVDEHDLYSIMYTTGTTGMPKGVCLTHRNKLAALHQFQMFYTGHTHNDVILLSPPLGMAGADSVFFSAVSVGAAIGLHVFNGKSFAELVEQERVTNSNITPTRYRMIRDYLDSSERKYDMSSLRYMPIGGQGTSATQLKELRDYFGVTIFTKAYGTTETTSAGLYLVADDVVAGMRPDASEKEREVIDSVGKPVWGSAIRIVNEADRDVPVGEEGELALKGEFIAQGYWKNPELTEKEFRDGWWYSGDLATMDKDGYVYIAGRKDDMIKSGGLKVHRTEVEGVILKHQAIREVAVFGLPDPKWGQSITAVVSCKEGHQASEDDLKGHCRESLAGFQVPKTIYFMKDLPKDPSGNKVLVKELKKLYSGQVM